MLYRSLGTTDLNVSILSLGGAGLGDMYGSLAPGEAASVVHRAIDAGINLIDTSPFYGLTRSESVIGEALAGGRREKMILCSKAGRNGPSEFDFTPEAMERSVDASLKRLRTDYLDILIAHDIEFAADFEQVFTETADCLHRLKEKGKTRFVGMSAYPLGILVEAVRRCRLDVVISYTQFSLQNTRLLSELLPVALENGVGVLNASPLSMGLLTNGGPQPWHPASEEVRRICRQAADHCTWRGYDIAELGMQFCLGESRIASTITGASRIAEIERNLATLSRPIDTGLLVEVLDILAPIRNQVWPSGNWPTGK